LINGNGPEKVILHEVCPRDGLQNEPTILSHPERAELINGLARAGLSWIQVGSFVNPARVPQMAGTDLVWQLVDSKETVRHTVLVLNARGLDQAIATRIPIVEVYISASETHSRKNANSTVGESLAAAVHMIRRASKERLHVTAGVMCAFGCHYEGSVSVGRVRELVAELAEASPQLISLADTTGMGHPNDIASVLHSIRDIVPPDRLSLHLHDTFNRGYENLRAGLEMGVRRFDTSLGGLGGCPFIPGARGNISTGRTVELVEALGFQTGLDLKVLRFVRVRLETLLGRALVG
jgi:hydroxymethylglutaryl-CoA lyase